MEDTARDPDDPSSGSADGTDAGTATGTAAGAPLTRAALRAHRDHVLRHPVLPSIVTQRRPLLVLATVAVAVLLGVAARADDAILAAAVAWAGVVLAWGWPHLLGSSSRMGSSLAVGFGAIAGPVTVALTPDEPYLRHVPAVVAASLVGMFLHQLLRRDGRPRLVTSVAVTAAGLAVVTTGVLWLPLGRTWGGPALVVAACAGIALGALADLAAPVERVRAWMMPMTMVLGAVGGALAALAQGHPRIQVAILPGMICSAVAHAVRRLLATMPAVTSVRGQASAASASVLLPAVVTYVVGRLLVG